MKLLKLSALLLASTLSLNVAHASKCDGMKIEIVNNTSDEFHYEHPNVVGGSFQPATMGNIAPKSTIVFTLKADKRKVNVSMDMFPRLSRKQAHIQFELKGDLVRCDHSDKGSTGTDVSVAGKHFGDTVTYTIN